MIAELVRQYDILKRCNIPVPDPYFDELAVWVEIILKSDGSFRVNWLGKPKDTSKDKKTTKEEPCKDVDCPVTEKSACRASGNDSPHGLVDNASWMFGRLLFDPKTGLEKDKQLQERQQSYLKQLREFCDSSPNLSEMKIIYDTIADEQKKKTIWAEVEKLLHTHIGETKWKKDAGKAKIRWVIEKTGQAGKPVNSLEDVKNGWKAFRRSRNEWWITSLIDGKRTPARILHPKIGRASLISFNNAATYCGHLSPEYRGKPGKEKEEADGGKEKKHQKSRQVANHGNKKEETDGSALPAQVGFEEAEKYSKALDWLIENSSIRFGGDLVICIWIDQGQLDGQKLDRSAYKLVKPQNEKSTFTRGKAKSGKGSVLPDSGDLLKALQRFRNGQEAGYRDKRFYLLSLLLRRKGRHAILGSYVGTIGLLDDNANKFVSRTKILIPARYLNKKDEAREFCPTLMDILSAAGIKSEKKQRLVWDREVVEVIVAGRPLPADLCRLVIQKAIKDKHLERSEKKRTEYRALLAIAAGCARQYLTAIMGKENYDMKIDTGITDAGYLAGRLFALCENIQKRGRDWGPTLSDKLFSAAINMPRQTLAQLYTNCRCYDIYKTDSEWFAEIFNKVKLNDSDSGQGEVLPENGVDQFAFILGYWHQRSELSTVKKASNNDNNTESQAKQ